MSMLGRNTNEPHLSHRRSPLFSSTIVPSNNQNEQILGDNDLISIPNLLQTNSSKSNLRRTGVSRSEY